MDFLVVFEHAVDVALQSSQRSPRARRFPHVQLRERRNVARPADAVRESLADLVYLVRISRRFGYQHRARGAGEVWEEGLLEVATLLGELGVVDDVAFSLAVQEHCESARLALGTVRQPQELPPPRLHPPYLYSIARRI